MKVSNENVFQIPFDKEKFTIGYSTSGYTLQYSADCVGWTSWEEATPANEVAMVMASQNVFWRLKDNVGEVNIQY